VTAADAVLFDLDGCLVDSRRAFAASINAALEAHGRPSCAEADLVRFIGPPLHATFEELLGGPGPDVESCVAAYRERYREQGAVESAVFPGIVEALAELSARVPLAVATSKPQPSAESLLEALGLRQWFCGIAGPSFEARAEPKAVTMRRALDLLPRRPAAAVMVGDRRYDIEGAKAHGLRAVGVLWGAGSEDELRAAGADALASTPAELPALVLSAAARG
jgi:phosphoglycolate phosphatase